MLVLAPPVPGPIVRPFVYAGSPFRRGLHRGLDLRAAAGQRVVAPCPGRVAWAGPRGVTLVCSGRRVTLLPVRPAVRAGAGVGAGVAVGTVVGGAGLHLGVRRAGDPFGYVDPAPLLRRSRAAPPPVVAPARGPRGTRRVPAPAVRSAPEPRRAAPRRAPPLAPPLAWGGAALLMLGVAGGARVREVRTRRRRAVLGRAGPEAVP